MYDAIVVGGGVMGLSSARALLEKGLSKVLVLERDVIGNDRAASTDRTKAIRYEYAEQMLYSRMAGRAIELWEALERQAGAQLYVNCGVMCWGRGEDSQAGRSYATLKEMGLPIEASSPEDINQRFPQFSLPQGAFITYNPQGGFLRASDCVAALASEVTRRGGEIRSSSPVTSLEERREQVYVRLAYGSEIGASRVILAAGAWTAKILPRLGVSLPVTANRQQVVYLAGLGEEFMPGPFPVFLNLDHEFYGFPLDSQGLLKASIHYPGPVIDPEKPLQPDPTYTERIRELIATYIPRASLGQVALERTCMYAMTPDENFIIDRLPDNPRVTLLAGFSGHGFKFGILVGRLAAALALGEEPEFSLASFRISRFG